MQWSQSREGSRTSKCGKYKVCRILAGNRRGGRVFGYRAYFDGVIVIGENGKPSSPVWPTHYRTQREAKAACEKHEEAK